MTAITKRITRQHKSGNSYSVRLPMDMAWPDPNQELEIEAVGDTRVLRPKRPSFAEMFRRMDALGPCQLGEEALLRGLGRPDPWHVDD